MRLKESKLFLYIKSYIRSGNLLLMIFLFPFFINNGRTGLEIFRERLNLSIWKKLSKKFYLLRIRDNFDSAPKKKIPLNCIWFMWLQGIEFAPEFCQANFNYLNRIAPGRVILITSKNVLEYINLPNFIIHKWKKGIISDTHFSDIVRIQLICTYGGTWVDSTVVVKKDFIENLSNFQIPQTYKPGRNGNVIPVSSWFIHANSNNKFLIRVRDLLFKYWQLYDFQIDYFLLHYFLEIASKENNNYLDNIKPLDNTLAHWIMLKVKKESLSKQELSTYLNDFSIMKFTNKYETLIEKNNYKIITMILKSWR